MLKKLWNLLLAAERAVMIIASIVVVALVFISVIARYIFEKNIQGMEELIVFVAFWIYFAGATYGSYENSHINADILSVFVKNEKLTLVIHFLRNLITTIILISACYCSVELFLFTLEAGGATDTLKIPRMVVYMPIFIGIFLMTFYTAVHMVEDAIKLVKGNRKEVEA